MTKEPRITKTEWPLARSGFGIRGSFVIGHSVIRHSLSRPLARPQSLDDLQRLRNAMADLPRPRRQQLRPLLRELPRELLVEFLNVLLEHLRDLVGPPPLGVGLRRHVGDLGLQV